MGGAPLREKGGKVRFYVVTPVVIVAEGAEYSELHRQFFGDPWMYPAAGVEADAVNAARRMGALGATSGMDVSGRRSPVHRPRPKYVTPRYHLTVGKREFW